MKKIYLLFYSLLFCSIFTITEHLHANSVSTTLLKAAYEEGLKNNFKKAERLYKKALENGGNKTIITYNLGNLYYRKGNLPKAIQFYKNVIKMTPNFKQSYLNLAKIYYSLEDYVRALRIFLTYLEINKNDYETLMLVGDTYKKIHIYDFALLSYQKAKNVNSKSEEPHLAMALLYQELIDNDRAINYLEEGQQIHFSSLKLYRYHAEILKQSKKYREAASVYRSILTDSSLSKEISREDRYNINLEISEAFYLSGLTNMSVYVLKDTVEKNPKKRAGIEFLQSIFTSDNKNVESFEFFSNFYDKNPIVSYLAIKEIMSISYNNQDIFLLKQIVDFYERKKLRDELFDLIKNEISEFN